MLRFSLLGCSMLAAGLASAQTSELFLTSYQSTDAYVVQNGQIVRQFQRTDSSDGPALVVQGTIKMYGQASGNIGREYDLNGNLLSGQYPNAGFTDCYDGATDGTRNWTISHNDFNNNFAVLVGDTDWNNLQIAFVPVRRSSGIAHDATDDTLWITNNVGGSDRVQHFDTAGNLLGEFAISLQSGGGYGIALDPADQTLWIPGAFGTAGRLDQYSKTGTLLQTVNVPGLSTNVMGAEFAVAGCPAPFTYCTGKTNSAGCVPQIGWAGSPNAAGAGQFDITQSNHIPGKFGLLFYSTTGPASVPFQGGFLCAASPLRRTPGSFSTGAGACGGVHTFDFNARIASGIDPNLAAGQDVWAQWWGRDMPGVTSLSDALQFRICP